jgi:hypothetical protein
MWSRRTSLRARWFRNGPVPSKRLPVGDFWVFQPVDAIAVQDKRAVLSLV